MSSSDGTGSVRKTAGRTAVPEPESPAGAPGAQDDGLADPWFAPDPKLTDDGHAVQFLPAGRAGLLPDSMTESWKDDGTVLAQRAEAAGAPPWGRNGTMATGGEPPPWETGPWPGPGEPAARQPRPAVADPGVAHSAVLDLATDSEPWRRSRLIMVGGAAALVVIVVIVVIVVATSGGTGGCATYPAAVRQAYGQAMSDLSGRTAASVQAADLEKAATLANSAAVAAGQSTARSALFAMAGDLDEAFSDVMSHRPITPDLQQRLAAEGTALPRSC